MTNKPADERKPLMFFVEKWRDQDVAKIDEAVKKIFGKPSLKFRNAKDLENT